ncbi:MAG: type II toxin-antitoxin system RelE/ParE family toxin [Verrucomicrobia bacterium]|nr:type II toxin-antitoxin system RelE/ParE family toxin [Verrucomicrobiota bacterium]
MGIRLELTHEARADLMEIWRYIAEDDKQVASKFLDRLYVECEKLASLGSVGRSRTELGGGVLSYFFKRYVIFFTRDAKRLTVLRVLHGARDQSKVFDN